MTPKEATRQALAATHSAVHSGESCSPQLHAMVQQALTTTDHPDVRAGLVKRLLVALEYEASLHPYPADVPDITRTAIEAARAALSATSEPT
jgi:hypothetical protein